MRYTIALVRSILFWLLFVMMSSISSIGGVIALPVSHRGTIWFVRIWAQSHRLFCRFVLGQRIVVEGAMPDIPVLYVFKHESAFETVEQPMLFKHPAVFAKEELFSIPVWGQAARFYGLIPVDRDGGGKAMRAMLGAAKAALAKGRPLVLRSEEHTSELQSLMRISYAVFCLKKKKQQYSHISITVRLTSITRILIY